MSLVSSQTIDWMIKSCTGNVAYKNHQIHTIWFSNMLKWSMTQTVGHQTRRWYLNTINKLWKWKWLYITTCIGIVSVSDTEVFVLHTYSNKARESWISFSYKVCRLNRAPSSEGTRPENWFASRFLIWGQSMRMKI